jgi:predicted glutamine amidotransferase
MCGIFGCSLKLNSSPYATKMAFNKVKILGLYNETRGRDSCGMFIDGNVYKGVNAKKNFDDFIEETILPYPKTNLVILGHTRQSTKGSHIEKNAHPFTIKERLVGVHNGVIHNIDDLCKKYEFDAKAAGCDVDSHMLYNLLDQEGFSILNEYIGFAALAFTYIDDPNVLYLYHGASKTYKSGKLFEERPLFFMETAEGTYFSSLESSLKAIRDNEADEISILEHNTVFQLKNGKFTKSQWAIERDDNNIAAPSQSCSVGNSKAASSNSSTGKDTTKNSAATTTNSQGAGVSDYKSLVMRETVPLKCYNSDSENFVYYHRGRYWRNKRTLCTGEYHLLDKGYISGFDGLNGSKRFFFYRGVMLKDEAAYRYLLEIEKNPTSFVNNKGINFAACMSRVSRYPVCNLPEDNTTLNEYHRNAWYESEKRYNGSFTPKFSGRHYAITSGFLTEIKSSQREEVLHKNQHHADTELLFFCKGGATGVLGGTPTETFPSDRKSPTTYVRKPEVITGGLSSESCSIEPQDAPGKKFFYDQTFESIEKAMEFIGEMELKALRKYAKDFLEEDSPLDADDREIEIAVFELIDAAIKNKTPIIELCESEEDRIKLISAYEKQLVNAYNDRIENSKDEEAPADVIDTYIESTSIFNEQSVNEQDMNAQDIMEDMIGTLENWIGEAEGLTDDVESDLSQEVANAIYKSVTHAQNELRKVLVKNNLGDLIPKLDAINKKRTMV